MLYQFAIEPDIWNWKSSHFDSNFMQMVEFMNLWEKKMEIEMWKPFECIPGIRSLTKSDWRARHWTSTKYWNNLIARLLLSMDCDASKPKAFDQIFQSRWRLIHLSKRLKIDIDIRSIWFWMLVTSLECNLLIHFKNLTPKR